jgi:hypothetical protein
VRDIILFVCDDCGLEVHLHPPVERPCPNCGGNFVKMEPWKNGDRDLYTSSINRVVKDNFDQLFIELESYLAEQVEK